MLLATAIKETIANWRSKSLLRQQRVVARKPDHANMVLVDGLELLDFTSNDYLGLQHHRGIATKFSDGALQYGLGSGSASLICGYSPAHQKLERQFSEWLEVDRALLFSSGYLANAGLYSCLFNRNSHILADKLCHASIIDGIQLSRAKHHRYQHDDITDVYRLAARNKPDVIVSEGVFSMEGDLASIPDLVLAAKKFAAGLVLDDAHGIGVLGETGRGVAEQFALQQTDYSCMVYPLGKAFNGVGALIAGQADVIEAILQFARTYRYNTALPPAICVGLQEALRVVSQESWRREQLNDNIALFNQRSCELGLPLISTDLTPIRALLIGDTDRALLLQQQLKNNGYNVYATRWPTVPKDSSRLRISLNSLHTPQQINSLLEQLARGLSGVAN